MRYCHFIFEHFISNVFMVLCIFIFYKNILLNKENESENSDSSIHCTYNTSLSYASHNSSY